MATKPALKASNRSKRNQFTMLKKGFKFLGKILLTILSIFVMFLIAYLINPDYVQKKTLSFVYPTLNISDAHANKITTEVPEVYELMQIACSLTDTFQKDNNLIQKKTAYYTDVENHFMKMKNHPLILKINSFILENAYNQSTMAIRFLSLNYNINEQEKLVNNGSINLNGFLQTVLKSKAFLLSKNEDLVNDFIKKSDFKAFYKKHTAYYKILENNNVILCDFENMKEWLEGKFSSSYSSYRIIFSPLTGGFHNTMSFKDKKRNEEQTFMFVNAPPKNITHLTKDALEIKASRQARIVFTEIDHNYVNPLTNKNLDELNDTMKDLTFWNSQKKGMYRSNYKTFNEYMTWGVFNLYATDTYSAKNIDSILKIQTNFMDNGRKFHHFTAFSNELLKQYKEKQQPKIEELYPSMLLWMKNKEKQSIQ